MVTKKTDTNVVKEESNVMDKNPDVITVGDGKKQPSKDEGNKVQVDADVLQGVLQRIKNLEEQNQELTQAQKEYEQTASQDQIMRIEKMRASGKLIKSVRLNFYENKLVTSWRSTSDDVYIEPGSGKEIAVQQTELHFYDGSKKEVPQLDFARRKLQREYEVIKEGKNQDGDMLYTVMMEGGEEVEINGNYIN